MTTLPDELKVLDQSRLRAYRENLDFYQGIQWSTTSRKERQLTFNYVKTGIDKLTSYMMGSMDFAVEPAAPPKRAASGTGRAEARSAASGTGPAEVESAKAKALSAERALYAVYQDNGLEALDFDTERGTAYLRDAAIAGSSGEIVVPVNAGQELYDVITITDARAGLSAVKRRILGLKLLYDPRKGIFTHTLALGAV